MKEIKDICTQFSFSMSYDKKIFYINSLFSTIIQTLEHFKINKSLGCDDIYPYMIFGIAQAKPK